MAAVNGFDERPVRTALWLIMVLGLLTLGVGVFLIAAPDETLKVLTVIFGVLLIIDGVVALALSFVGRGEGRVVVFLLGLIGVVAGLVIVKKPFAALNILVIVLGIWFVVAGISRALFVLTNGGRKALPLLAAALDVVIGAVILSWPELSLKTLAIIAGIALVLRGLLSCYAAWVGLRMLKAGETEGLPYAA